MLLHRPWNLAYRFRQVDKSTALPVTLGGRYHLPGDIKIADDKTLQSMIERTKGLLKGETNPATLVLPPLPRYISGGCCQTLHGPRTNVGEERYKEGMVEKIRHMRKVYRKELTGKDCKAWIGHPIVILNGKEQ